ncbi:hypothetical protein RE628_08070 [Paenibacillus sp. D2_2]|uniref:hypothetical protein n=1 Tax=Paenibacillus sp. D2_2 TaxID=3073092 RepID=UPI002814CDB5|nr:hypothetical protein [Paenibacillus sp. D2_2]WMT42335.1 hypothetical protein RE628_08070 [Paenibacillus sp. D2_2]
MFSKKNKIANVLLWVGVSIIVIGLISGLVMGEDSETFLLTIIYWVSGFLSGMFFIALAEIIEQLHKINLNLSKDPDQDDLELLN